MPRHQECGNQSINVADMLVKGPECKRPLTADIIKRCKEMVPGFKVELSDVLEVTRALRPERSLPRVEIETTPRVVACSTITATTGWATSCHTVSLTRSPAWPKRHEVKLAAIWLSALARAMPPSDRRRTSARPESGMALAFSLCAHLTTPLSI